MAACNQMRWSEYLRGANKKRAAKGRYKEFVEVDPKQIVLNMDLSDSMMNYLKDHGIGFMKNAKETGKLVKRLLTLRNEIITNCLYKQKYKDDTQACNHLAKKDFLEI